MNIQVDDIGPCRKRLRIEVPYSEMEEDVLRIKRRVQQNANVPGFRIGRAPGDLVERYYGGVIQNEVVRRTINESYKKAVSEKDLHPVCQPAVEDVDYKKGEGLKFKFELEVAPDFDLPEYTGIRLERKKRKITDKDIEAELKYLQERNAYFEPVSDRGAEMGDFIVADYTIKHKGEICENAEQVWLEMRDDFFIPKFCHGISGMKKGEERDIKAVMPKEYAKESLRGRKVVITVKVEEIKRKVLPELTDEFAKGLGNIENLHELRRNIKRQLEAYFAYMAEQDLAGQIENYFLKNTAMDVPETIVSDFHNALYEDRIAYIRGIAGVTESLIREKKEDIEKSVRRDAVSRAKLVYIFDKIAEKEAINITEDDINAALDRMAEAENKKKEEVKAAVTEKDGWWNLKYRIRNRKIIKFLMEKADIKEVTKEDR